MLERLRRHHCADRVASPVFGARAAAPVPIEAGEGVGTALLELSTEDVTIGHRTSMSGRAGEWLLPSGAPEQRRFRRALTALKSPPNPALADQGSWRAKGDRDEYGEPPAPAVLADATDAKEEKEEKADPMDRTENVDYTLGMEERLRRRAEPAGRSRRLRRCG